MSLTKQHQELRNLLSQIDKEHHGATAQAIAFWFEDNSDTEVVVLPPITQNKKQAEAKAKSVKKKTTEKKPRVQTLF